MGVAVVDKLVLDRLKPGDQMRFRSEIKKAKRR